jgi:hypothetical protein
MASDSGIRADGCAEQSSDRERLSQIEDAATAAMRMGRNPTERLLNNPQFSGISSDRGEQLIEYAVKKKKGGDLSRFTGPG